MSAGEPGLAARRDDPALRNRLDVAARQRVDLLGDWTLLRARPDECGAVDACAGGRTDG